MAGAGYKSFTTGDVLTASDLNTYGIEQTIMVFASSTARDTALSSAKSEGMFAFLKDSDSLTYYDGSSWTVVDLAGDITGVTAGTALSGGGTSGTVTVNVDVNSASTVTGTTSDYMLIADVDDSNATKKALISDVVATGDITGVTAGTNISGGGTSGTVTVNLAIDADVAVGADGAGVDMTWHSATSGDYAMWDASEEKLIIEGTNGATALDVTDGNVVIGDGTLTVGSDGAGEDVTFHSDTSGDYMQWDSSAEKLILEGTNGATVLDVTDGNVVIGDGTLTVGSDGAGEDVTFYSDTAGDSMVWDSSAESLTITGTAGQDALAVAAGDLSLNSASISSWTDANIVLSGQVFGG